ncbi:hypothetical protein ACFX1X_019945 [Malus domestica]
MQINVILSDADMAVNGSVGVVAAPTHQEIKGERWARWLMLGRVTQRANVQPIYGLLTAPLVPPNNEVGINGMVTSLATGLAGVVMNSFDDGYFQGTKEVPLEAVSECTSIFGKRVYPSYPQEVVLDKMT